MRHFKVLFVVISVMILSGLHFNTTNGDDEIYSNPVETTVEVVDETQIEKTILIEKVGTLVGDESISTAIVEACMKHTVDYKLCIKNVIGVSNAESSIFKAGMKPSNNGFGWMYQGKKKKFSSVEDSVYQRVKMYQKNGWYDRNTGASRLKGRYCTSACTNWVGNYNSAINKLGLD